MTEEEFRNLKVGDCFLNGKRSDIYFINKVISHNDHSMIVNCIETNYPDYGNPDITWDYESCSACTTLPLYNSPLYLAMSEADAPNEMNEEE